MNHVLKHRVRAGVLATLKDGSTFRGVLWDYDKQALVLRNVEHVVGGADRATPVDGELVVLMGDVMFIQIP